MASSRHTPGPARTTTRAASAISRAALRRELGIQDADICIVFVGRLVPVKSPGIMLESFARHARRRSAPSKLVMVGDGHQRFESNLTPDLFRFRFKHATRGDRRRPISAGKVDILTTFDPTV